MKNINININNTQLIDALVGALGENAFIDSVLARLHQETLQQVITGIMAENGLEWNI